MRYIAVFLLALLSVSGLTACAEGKDANTTKTEPPEQMTTNDKLYTGTIIYKQLEGGFFALITNDNQRFTLRHLPAEFRLDGLIVEIQGSVNKDIVTFTQFGEPLDVSSVTVLDDSHARPPEASPKKLKSL